MVEAVSHSALDDQPVKERRGAISGASPGVALAERSVAAIAQINGAPEGAQLARALAHLELDSEPEARRAVTGRYVTLLWTGPGQFLAIAARTTAEDMTLVLRDAVEPARATVTDLSHARTVIRISGPESREVLLKGCPLDIEAMVKGDCAASLVGHLNAIIHCVDERVFDVYVFRSFGLAMWNWLIDAAEEFGVEVWRGE